MAEIQNTPIPRTSAIASASAGYKAVSSNETFTASSQSRSQIFVVVGLAKERVLLQDQSNGGRVNLDLKAIKRLDNSTIQKGDRLVLISTSGDLATLSLQKNGQNAPQITASLAQKLNLQWPDISQSTLRKLIPNILNEVNLGANLALQEKTLSNLVSAANTFKNPALELLLKAKVLSSASNKITLQVFLGDQIKQGSIKLDLPVTKELAAKLAVGSNLSVALKGSNFSQFIQSIKLDNKQAISSESLNIVNRALSKNNA